MIERGIVDINYHRPESEENKRKTILSFFFFSEFPNLFLFKRR